MNKIVQPLPDDYSLGAIHSISQPSTTQQLAKVLISRLFFSTGQISIAAQFSWIFNREGAKDAKENDENFAHFAASRLNFKVCPVEKTFYKVSTNV